MGDFDDDNSKTIDSTTVLTNFKNPDFNHSSKKLIGLLQVVEGADKGKIIALENQGNTLVGRSVECHVVLDDASCSRKHAEITKQANGSFLLTDLQSTNGTQVNQVSIKNPTHIKSGDKIIFGKSSVVLFSVVDENDANLQISLYNRATQDTLTGAANRYRFNEAIEKELAHRDRNKSGLGLIMFDVDHFKKINDSRGHPAGDSVLKEIGKRMRETIRKEDLFARIGGEEFVLLSRNNSAEELLGFAERIRIIMNSKPVTHGQDQISFSVSLGCCFIGGTKKVDSKTFVELADQALYQAKQGGRNQSKMLLP